MSDRVRSSDCIAAYQHTSRHRKEIEASEVCGCFYCLATFEPAAIEHWLNEGDGTAICPECGIDSVIGARSGFPISREFLERMHQHWFMGKA